MRQPIVRCTNVTKRYGDSTAVDDCTFDLVSGEIVSVLGPSGSGKTTLLRMIAGFQVPDEGQIRIDGKVVSTRSIQVAPDRRNVGMVFQEYALFPHMTVAQNVAFGIKRLPDRERRRRSAEMIDLVRLQGLEERYPHELSGGQQQRVALARTLARRPVTLLLDEPFSNLDASMRREMRQEVEGILLEHGTATMLVTHDREEAFAIADRVGVMRNGRLEQLDEPNVVYHSPATPFVARMTGTCDFLRGEVRSGLATTEVGAFPFTSRNGSSPEEGAQIELMVHPDAFRIVPAAEGDCTVRSREFRGDDTMLVVALPSGSTLRCRQRSQSTLEAGTRVKLVAENASPFLAFQAPQV